MRIQLYHAWIQITTYYEDYEDRPIYCGSFISRIHIHALERATKTFGTESNWHSNSWNTLPKESPCIADK